MNVQVICVFNFSKIFFQHNTIISFVFQRLVFQVTAVTHGHPQGLLGAWLQAQAIVLALETESGHLDPMEFVTTLQKGITSSRVKDLLKEFSASRNNPPEERIKEAIRVFEKKLETVMEFLQSDDPPEVSEVIKKLGTNQSLVLIAISVDNFRRIMIAIYCIAYARVNLSLVISRVILTSPE